MRMKRIKITLLAATLAGITLTSTLSIAFETLPCVVTDPTPPPEPVKVENTIAESCPSQTFLDNNGLICDSKDTLIKTIADAVSAQKEVCKTNPATCGITVASFDSLEESQPETTQQPTLDPNSPDAAITDVTPVEAYCKDDAEHCGISPEIIQSDVIAYCQDSPTVNCGINQENILGAPRAGETEPNNHFRAADPITATMGILRGQIASSSDQDWFAYAINNKSSDNNNVLFKTLVITLNASANAWHVSVRDETGNLLTSSDTIANEKEDFILESTVLVSENTQNYYIVIESVGVTLVDAPYGLTVKEKTSLNPASAALSANVHDTETEPNSEFKEADKLSSGIVLVASHPLGGTRNNGDINGDIDIFEFSTEGNETVNFALCPENTGCNANNGIWAAFVFADKEKAIAALQFIADQTLPTANFDKEVWKECITDKSFCKDADQNGRCDFDDKIGVIHNICVETKEFYILADRGLFGDALFASIDPVFGNANNLDFGLLPKGNYYAVVARVMKKNGVTFLFADEITEGPDAVGFTINNRSDDPYTVQVTKTSLTPNVEEALTKNKLQAVRAHFDTDGMLRVPEAKVGDHIFKGNLRIVPNTNPILFQLEDATKVINPISE